MSKTKKEEKEIQRKKELIDEYLKKHGYAPGQHYPSSMKRCIDRIWRGENPDPKQRGGIRLNEFGVSTFRAKNENIHNLKKEADESFVAEFEHKQGRRRIARDKGFQTKTVISNSIDTRGFES